METLGHTFHCRIVRPLCRLIEDIMRGKFFALDANSVCSSVVLLLTKAEHYVGCYASRGVDDATEGILWG